MPYCTPRVPVRRAYLYSRACDVDGRPLRRVHNTRMRTIAIGVVCLMRLGGPDTIALQTTQSPAAQQPARTPDIFFTPTLYGVADDMLRLAGVGTGDVVYDLGSGDGRILILAAQKYGARAVGIELDPRLVELSRQIAREGEVAERVTIVEGDLFTADISSATVVTLYLSPGVNRRLEEKLRQLRPGTRIVSHQFPIGSWKPDRVVRAEDDRTDLFLWTVPPR